MEGTAEIVEVYIEPAGEADVEYLDSDPDGFVEPPVDPGGFDDDDVVGDYTAGA